MKRIANGHQKKNGERPKSNASFCFCESNADGRTFTYEEECRLQAAKDTGLFFAFERAIKEALPNQTPRDMRYLYIGFFKKATLQNLSYLHHIKEIYGEDVQFWVADEVTAIVSAEGFLHTFIPMSRFSEIALKTEQFSPKRGPLDPCPWVKTPHGYAAWRGEFYESLRSAYCRGDFNRPSMH